VIQFSVPLRPKPSPRPRTNGFLPRDYVKWKSDFGLLVPYTAKQNLSGLVKVFIYCRYATPKKQSKDVLTPAGDVDNLAKSVMDALQDCGVIKNDRQVVSLTVAKAYSVCDEVEVRIENAS